jgi:leader peptidase (prepilin peptidase)/N-methyltransferase
LRARLHAHTVAHRDTPPPPCPQCASPLHTQPLRLHSLPVTGGCPSCRTAIGPGPLAVEAVAALLVGVLAWSATSAWIALAWCGFGLAALILATVDATVLRLPAPVTAAATTLAVATLAAQAIQHHQPGAFGRAAIGAALYALLALALVLLPARNPLGVGDAMLAVPIGLLTAWQSTHALLTAMLTPPLLAAGTVTVLLLLRRTRLDRPHPLGPHMLTGALLALLLTH